jgi:hypothetical protein
MNWKFMKSRCNCAWCPLKLEQKAFLLLLSEMPYQMASWVESDTLSVRRTTFSGNTTLSDVSGKHNMKNIDVVHMRM